MPYIHKLTLATVFSQLTPKKVGSRASCYFDSCTASLHSTGLANINKYPRLADFFLCQARILGNNTCRTKAFNEIANIRWKCYELRLRQTGNIKGLKND